MNIEVGSLTFATQKAATEHFRTTPRADSVGAGAPEIVCTADMIEEGVRHFLASREICSLEALVQQVYWAMETTRLGARYNRRREP
jgi:hypothetical protein